MTEINFGVNIVEIVTHGLYKNALDIFREYIQNSCDAIDNAINGGTLNSGDGKITIDIAEDERRITIADNGIGISTQNFRRVMGNIGNSDKRIDTDRGFRGIGRLGGLAYCKELIFSTKAAGERKISVLTFTAEKLRKEFFNGEGHLAKHVLIDNMHFDTIEDADPAEHFFRVEMIDIVDTNEDLLDVEKICDYLSFVAPVAYSPKFAFRKEIHEHAAEIGFTITEYDIRVNDEPIFKNYTTDVKTRQGTDEIFDVEFRDIRDEDKKLIAWLWFGLSTFKGVLSEQGGTDSNKMRGIRLRMGNIQIGDNMVFQPRNFFGEERGTKYFIGEVHAADRNLIPNSRRDYFEENDARVAFERELKKNFTVLKKLYNYASDTRNEFKAVNEPEKFQKEITRHTSEYQETHKAAHDAEFSALSQKAADKKRKIDSKRTAAEKSPEEMTSRVFEHIDSENKPPKPPIPDDKNTPPHFHWKVGRMKLKNFTKTSTKSFLPTRNWRAQYSSTRLNRSSPNEPTRPAGGAELQKQIHSVEFDEVGDIFSMRVQGRRAIFQGRPETFRRTTVAGKIFRR